LATRLSEAAGENLISIILYGSAASGESDNYSDVNLLWVLHEASYSRLLVLSETIESWIKQEQRAPIIMTEAELQHSADVFTIEFLDMKRSHSVLFGKDLLAQLEIPMRMHRAQLEYELREKLILLRQRLLLAGQHEARTWEVLLHSYSAFVTLFRHVFIACGKMTQTRAETVRLLVAENGSEAAVFQQLLDARKDPASKGALNAKEAARQYLSMVERMTALVDGMPDAP